MQFTYTDVLARTVGRLPPENGVIERARAGIDEAISREQLIPLDREKGLFTSGIHVPVSYTHLDVYKRQRIMLPPCVRAHQVRKFRPVLKQVTSINTRPVWFQMRTRLT